MQPLRRPARHFGRTLGKTAGLALLGLSALGTPRAARADASGFLALAGHIPAAARSARAVARLDPAQTLTLALTLPLRHQAELDDLLRGQADPEDPRFGQFLTPRQFADRFAPTQADYDRAVAYARAVGLTVTATHPNRTVLDVAGTAAQAERAFGLGLLVYQADADGHTFYAPDANPQIPSALAGVLSGVVGLDSASRWRSHARLQESAKAAPDAGGLSPLSDPSLDPYAVPLQTGSGPGGGLTPSDIKKAYTLSGVSQTGAGQTLALFELDGYAASDVAAYESAYGLPAVPLQNVLVDGYSGAAGSGAGEVTLDIELQAALAPGATKILVYEAPNSDAGVVDAYNKIATDNLAKQVSTSWGLAEADNSAAVRNAENTAFQQMAAQGQSIFAAAGDSGADDNGSTLSVDDPASQPYMTGVGGTSLKTAGAGGAYTSETTWNRGSAANGAGGGGISTIWAIPSYQSGVASSASKGSATMRNVPDVSLDADPYTGYSIYFGGRWVIYGGTSCAAPLWAAFTALVNQQRAANGLGTLGFANTPIYAIGKGANYGADFHDVADGSTNLYYPAVTGYDDATGWGSFNGAALLADLSGGPAAAAPPVAAGHTYRIVNVLSGKAVDDAGASTAHGTGLIQYAINGGENQNWVVTNVSSGVTFTNALSKMNMDVNAASTSDGGRVIQWDVTNTPNQLWRIVPVGDGSYQIVSANSGLLLDDYGASLSDFGPLVQWHDNGGANQHWKFQLVR